MALTVKHAFTNAIADDPTAAAAGEVLPSHWNANHTVTGSVDATQMPALTGDVTTSAGAVATTLATVNSNVGTFGDATHVAQVTVNGKGQVTAASNVAISVSASPAGADTQIQFNDAGSFAGNAQLTFNKTNGSVAINSSGAASGITLLDVKNSNLSGTPGFFYRAYNGPCVIRLYQGNSGGGLELRDFNDVPLLGFGITVATAAWTVLGTGTSATIGDMAVNADNAYNMGSASANVKTIYHYTSALKPVTVAALPTGAFGMVAAVSDGTAALAWGATVTGGGSTHYLVWHNGTNWTVAGK